MQLPMFECLFKPIAGLWTSSNRARMVLLSSRKPCWMFDLLLRWQGRVLKLAGLQSTGGEVHQPWDLVLLQFVSIMMENLGTGLINCTGQRGIAASGTQTTPDGALGDRLDMQLWKCRKFNSFFNQLCCEKRKVVVQTQIA